MNGSVDVLAVLDAEIACKRIAVANGYSSEEVLNETEETRDAVAELIERARALRSAHCAFQDWKAKAPKRYPAPRSILEMNAHAKAMLFAALDRVGGAK